MVIIVSRSTVQLGKPMGTTNSNWSSETPNSHTLQARLVSGTSKNCNYSPCENSNLECGEASAVTYLLYHKLPSILSLYLPKEVKDQEIILMKGRIVEELGSGK